VGRETAAPRRGLDARVQSRDRAAAPRARRRRSDAQLGDARRARDPRRARGARVSQDGSRRTATVPRGVLGSRVTLAPYASARDAAFESPIPVPGIAASCAYGAR